MRIVLETYIFIEKTMHHIWIFYTGATKWNRESNYAFSTLASHLPGCKGSCIVFSQLRRESNYVSSQVLY
jgi:hypothetical protein